MHTPTPAQARTELARRGRNDLGRMTHRKSASKRLMTQAGKNRTFKLGTKTLVRLAQAEVPTQPEFVATGAAWVPEPTARTTTGSICLNSSSPRTLAAMGV